jgi:hypothetical protein
MCDRGLRVLTPALMNNEEPTSNTSHSAAIGTSAANSGSGTRPLPENPSQTESLSSANRLCNTAFCS